MCDLATKRYVSHSILCPRDEPEVWRKRRLDEKLELAGHGLAALCSHYAMSCPDECMRKRCARIVAPSRRRVVRSGTTTSHDQRAAKRTCNVHGVDQFRLSGLRETLNGLERDEHPAARSGRLDPASAIHRGRRDRPAWWPISRSRRGDGRALHRSATRRTLWDANGEHGPVLRVEAGGIRRDRTQKQSATGRRRRLREKHMSGIGDSMPHFAVIGVKPGSDVLEENCEESVRKR